MTSGYNLSVYFQIYMHGNNMAPLYSHVSEEVLPAEIGGSGPPYHIQSWAHTLIGQQGFSYSDKQIYWPSHCTAIK